MREKSLAKIFFRRIQIIDKPFKLRKLNLSKERFCQALAFSKLKILIRIILAKDMHGCLKGASVFFLV